MMSQTHRSLCVVDGDRLEQVTVTFKPVLLLLIVSNRATDLTHIILSMTCWSRQPSTSASVWLARTVEKLAV